MTKTTWTNTEITERLLKEAQAWVNEMNDITSSDDKDWSAYQIYYGKAMQTLDCINVLTGECYFTKTDADGKEVIYKWR